MYGQCVELLQKISIPPQQKGFFSSSFSPSPPPPPLPFGFVIINFISLCGIERVFLHLELANDTIYVRAAFQLGPKLSHVI